MSAENWSLHLSDTPQKVYDAIKALPQRTIPPYVKTAFLEYVEYTLPPKTYKHFQIDAQGTVDPVSGKSSFSVQVEYNH